MYRQAVIQLRHSKNLAFVIMVLSVGINTWFMVPDMFEHDPQPDYYVSILPYVFSCDIADMPPERYGEPTRNPIKWWLNCASFTFFENPKVLPMFFNIGVMPLVYFLGYYLTNDRLIGLIALQAFLINPLYSDWQTNGTYDQTWSFFLLLSVVLMLRFKSSGKAWLVYITSIASKSMSILYAPLLIITEWVATKNKRSVILFSVLTGLMMLYAFTMLGTLVGNSVGFFPENWEQAVFRNISLFWQIIPGLLALFGINAVFHAKTKPENKKLVILWMVGIFLMTPVIHLFTQQLTFSYRYVPFAAFMSVYAGMVLVELGNFVTETRLKIPVKAK